MIPFEKANELFGKYLAITPLDVSITNTVAQANKKILADRSLAKKCALVAVEEILLNGGTINANELSNGRIGNGLVYWREVKDELLNLQ